ncbi:MULTISPECIES: ABC-F family ATP-binding cassette domain-containing protein [Clostridium]|uniref:ABC-F family ATP-binding cassette domain-containing protein n=1 Tax=Clostridium TaxID=1485 RepID=UPI0018A8B979|nr:MULTISPECIES: ABC-F family ATP-binding cassette domain-containing protein [Clostridium]MDB1969154.1 ABC-F family ATP-binding cassette domain-containing protein [Clostridium tertium]MDU1278569.1 ABC-F family ATP-binding cassette domain-containing protein [Clostridium sp.]MDU2458675.1 ABC-F family ATP-binding cassette domain-containing protein [Clostridium sp.]MDU3406210.1 ABC-F family ATP-binding cassette domain-containing protein [Clostridium sp.]MDU7088462.1 ABC-F family ATP-binding casset
MNLITLENITKTYSEKVLLNNVTLNINDGDKIGLIGLNGAGKSTLLKILTGIDEFFDGKVVKGKNIRIEYLAQDTKYDDNSTILEQIFKGDTPEMKLLMEYEELLEKVNNDISLNDKLIALQSKIDTMNLWDLESDAKTILTKLGISDFNKKMSELSGGQKKRVFLASSLITPCELLVLDEPTNHLDSESIEWLEEYLNSRKGALIMITHDRYFLDRVTNKIIELDRGNLYLYEGNYSDFLEKKAERLQVEASKEEKRQKLILKELKWVRRGAKARTTKQKARLQRFDELVSTDYITVNTDIEMPFVGRRLGKKIIEINNISKSFDNKVLVKDFDYIFSKNDRIGVIGKNGAGKTTLVNMITGAISPDNGDIEIGDTVSIGTFSQDNTHMDLNQRAIDYIKEGGENIPTEDGYNITASQLAERFLFDGTMQYTPIEKLSGGERRRLHLLRVLMESPNVLILDEPTNDLDIETLKILEDFLDEFIGVVIIVSHDRYFLDRLCNKIFSYEGDGLVKQYVGNYSDYLIHKEYEIKPEKSKNEVKEKKTNQKENRNTSSKPKFTFKEQKEFEEIYSVIESLEHELTVIEDKMAKNASNYGALNELMKEKETLEEELLFKYERLEYLEDIANKIEEYKSR